MHVLNEELSEGYALDRSRTLNFQAGTILPKSLVSTGHGLE